MLKFICYFFVFGMGVIMTFWFWTKNSIKKTDLPDQTELKSFQLLAVMEGNEKYIVRFRVEGQEAWREVSKRETKLHYLEKAEYQRFDIIETTSYYIEKRCFRENRKLCSIETSYKIFVSPDSYFPKEF